MKYIFLANFNLTQFQAARPKKVVKGKTFNGWQKYKQPQQE